MLRNSKKDLQLATAAILTRLTCYLSWGGDPGATAIGGSRGRQPGTPPTRSTPPTGNPGSATGYYTTSAIFKNLTD